MAIFNKDMVETTTKNTFFQKEAYYDENCQVVMMNIEAGEDIGEETHDADQTTFVVSGEGQAVVDGHRTKVTRQPHDHHPQGRQAQHHQQGR